MFDVPEMSRTSVGRAAANLMDFQPGEKIAQVLAIKDFEKAEQFVLFATAKGVVKRTALSAYANILNKGIIAIGLEDGDELIEVAVTTGSDEVLLGTKQGMAIRFKESDVRPMGRPAGGVKGIELASEQPADDLSGGADAVVSMILVPSSEEGAPACMVLTACANGYGKRTAVGEYRLQRRGGSGVINIKTTERNGNVVALRPVCDDDELMLITEKGILMRTGISDIRETGRNAQGVKLIRVDEGDRLVAMAKIDVQTTEGDKLVTEEGMTGEQVAQDLKHEVAEDGATTETPGPDAPAE